jgi:predicted ATPase
MDKAGLANSRLVVITGGPGAGKTTVLLELERRGFRCSSEVARQIIREQVQEGGDALPWSDRDRYCRLMLERSIAAFLEAASSTEFVFFDRGIPDTLCYSRLAGLAIEEEILAACLQYRYAARVFLAPPWGEIYARDTERLQDFDEAVRTYELMVAAYRDCGYDVVEIPRVSPGDRADLFLRKYCVRV